MRVTTTRALTVAGIAAAVIALASAASAANAAKGDRGAARQKCITYAQKNASEAEPGARTAFYESCMHGMNTTAK